MSTVHEYALIIRISMGKGAPIWVRSMPAPESQDGVVEFTTSKNDARRFYDSSPRDRVLMGIHDQMKRLRKALLKDDYKSWDGDAFSVDPQIVNVEAITLEGQVRVSFKLISK